MFNPYYIKIESKLNSSISTKCDDFKEYDSMKLANFEEFDSLFQ